MARLLGGLPFALSVLLQLQILLPLFLFVLQRQRHPQVVLLAPPVLIVIGRVVTLIETLGRDLVRQMREAP